MKTYRKELWLEIPGRRGFVNLTPQVQRCLAESGISEGLCLVNPKQILLNLQSAHRAAPSLPTLP